MNRGIKESYSDDNCIQEVSQVALPANDNVETRETSYQNILVTNLNLHAKRGHVLGCILQLDGIELMRSTYKCENCQELFGTAQLLDTHVQEYEFVCEECSLCFQTQYKYELHEHSEHPATYFNFNKVTPTTKMHITRRLASEFP